jgi:hypothetical protein
LLPPSPPGVSSPIDPTGGFVLTRTLTDFELAARRVDADGPVRAGRLADLAGVSPATVVSWIVRGRRGVYLDGKKAGGKGWWTSRKALERFQAARAFREAAVGGPTPRQWEDRARRASALLAARLG